MISAEARQLQTYKEDPIRFVREQFGVEPDDWQKDVLGKFPHSKRQALLASKGVGKTAVLAWLCWNYLATRLDCKIAATSITSDNLRDGLWTEMAYWQNKSPFLKAAFDWNKERITSKESPSTHWMSARAWPKAADAGRQADTLAGLHADYLLFVLDEVGGIPDAVMAAAEAGLASGIESHIVMAGNPTMLEGPLYRAATRERALWDVTSINADPDNPKRSKRVSEVWAREQIDKYGRDNPWVLVNVFGQFPPSSLNALLGIGEVEEAMKRRHAAGAYEHAARIVGVDVARQGDDKTVIARRQGLITLPFVTLRNEDSHQVAGRVALEYDEWEADSIQIDATGGYGWGVIDALRSMNRKAVAVEFSGSPLNAGFLNKRAEIWWQMAQWVKEGGALPDDPELASELTTVTYSFKGDKIQIESKDQIKERLGRSPDLADALAITFAQPVAPRTVRDISQVSRYKRGRSTSGWAA